MNHRIQKINELIRQLLSPMIHQEFAEEYGIISVNFISVSKDLQNARVCFSVLPTLEKTNFSSPKDITGLTKTLQAKAYYFQNLLAPNLKMKFIPKLEFIYDKSQNSVDRVEKLFREIQDSKSISSSV